MGLPLFCAAEFIRVVSHPRLFEPPTAPRDALAFLDALLASPTARLLRPGRRFWRILGELVAEGGVRGNLVFDAQIAAVCIERGAIDLLTEDRDFARFSRIRRQRLR